MRSFFLIFSMSVIFSACNSETSNGTANGPKATVNVEADHASIAEGPKDPVCDMVKDASWTEYTMNGADTVWFCSETCKTAYEGNPKKYQVK